jgi:hypothetical protein
MPAAPCPSARIGRPEGAVPAGPARTAGGRGQALRQLTLGRASAVGHSFDVRLGRQFDLLLHVDETHAVVSLDAPDHGPQPDASETCPAGL